MSVVNFKEAKRPRNELELPNLHFIVVDDWVDVIGERAVMSWLRMYSWCDRSSEVKDSKGKDVDTWEQASIPVSLNSLMKKLSVSKATFYNKILKPLWNVGLIDIEEFKDSKSKGVKPLNIIVYKYPQNKFSLAVSPLKQVRNYDKDYSSSSKTFAKKGGRPKKQDDSPEADSSKSQQGVVQKENHGWFKNKTGDGLKIKPINSLNSITKIPNSITNNLDTLDTKADCSIQPIKMDSTIVIDKPKTKEDYFHDGFYKNTAHVPIKISDMLEVFTREANEARDYYNIILTAKKKVESESNEMIWLENEPQLVSDIVNAFSRSIQKIEKSDQVENKQGYLYQSMYQTIHNHIIARSRQYENPSKGIYYDWVGEGVDNE